MRRCAAAAKHRSAERDEAGSGTAIGVAIIFPMLMLVIVALHAITTATRTEQSLQAIADRAAHAASLCCLNIEDAQRTVRESVGRWAAGATPAGAVCANNAGADADVEFRHVDGDQVRDRPHRPDPVPSGGSVTVRIDCELPSSVLGVFALPVGGVDRSAVGVATVDPWRHRSALPPGTP